MRAVVLRKPFDLADIRFDDALSAAGIDSRALDAITGANAVTLFSLDGRSRP